MFLGFSSDDAIRYFINFREIPKDAGILHNKTAFSRHNYLKRKQWSQDFVILKEIQKIWRSGDHKERTLGPRKSSLQVTSTTLANGTRQTTKKPTVTYLYSVSKKKRPLSIMM